MKYIFIIGGTGILGKAIIYEALKEDYQVIVIGLEKDSSIPKKVTQIIADRKDKINFTKKVENINNIDILVDVADFSKEDAEQTYNLFKGKVKHFFILSTTLVYDRSKPYDKAIPSNYALAKVGELGGYVDRKLEIERFWRNKHDVNWTILRPYHIVSPHDSLLGCIPDHNRDPLLIKRILSEEPIVLCDGGNVKFNFVDARNIAKVILKSSENKKAFGKSYNVVNPKPILAKEYYEIIGKELGKKINIKNKPIEKVWAENKGWQLTTLPHVYDVSDLKKDIGFIPNISIEQSLKEAIKNYKPVNKAISEIEVHKRMTLMPRPKPIKWLFRERIRKGKFYTEEEAKKILGI
ncbi:MAG TPA: NAD-dependent epimerase/dehydratase family protein [Candidatus Nanoarchaeia archaeon]|nr:NAD-dependent epimerase/dehydratase family protein [Candidatus Nanoarchaeia archaeon]